MTLRIGIDARAAAEVPAGRGRFVRELLAALAARGDRHEYVLYARRPFGRFDERFRWRLTGLPDPLWNVTVGLTAHRDSDVFFSVNSYLTAWFTRVPTLLNVFDMIAWEAPEAAQQRASRIERATIRAALRRAAKVICNSRSTEEDLVRRFPRVNAKTVVVPLAAADAFARQPDEAELADVAARYRLAQPFVLSTGTLEPRKNLVRLINAFAALPELLRERHLLTIVGPRGWDEHEILRRAEALGESIRVIGPVSDADLNCLYRLCAVCCYPSLYEGFGLPVLEAMTAGAAVVTSAVSSLPEVGGDGARYVDPTSVEQIRDALAAVLSSDEERGRLGEQARRQAASFSWARTAAQILAQLEAVARSRS